MQIELTDQEYRNIIEAISEHKELWEKFLHEREYILEGSKEERRKGTMIIDIIESKQKIHELQELQEKLIHTYFKN